MPATYTDMLAGAFRSAAGRVAERLGAYAHGVPAVPGTGSQFGAMRLPRDSRQQRIVESREALAGRTTYGAGPVPNYISTYAGGLTASRIRAIHNEVLVAGWMTNKASLDEDIMLADAHLHSVDGTFRDGITGRPFSVEPCDDSDLALHVADYLTAVVDRIDSYQESCRRLLFGNAGGYAIEEAVFDESPQPLSCLIGGETVTVSAYHPRQRQHVSNKHSRWEVQTDDLLIDMGRGAFVTPPPHKFVVFECSGDFQVRRRGYLYPGVWLHLIKTNAIARWAVVLEVWGIPVPWGKVQYDLWQDATRRSEYEGILQDAGRGKPFLATDDLDIQKAFETSSGDARGMHAALCGWATTEQSKLVLGSSLVAEVGGQGSYALSETHANTTEVRIANTARRLSESERKWYREVLKLACYLVNEDGSLGEINPRGLCAVLNASPDEIISKCGIPHWRIQREMTPAARMALFSAGVNDLGLEIDASQPYAEFGFKRPRRKSDPVLKGKTQVLADTDRTAPSVGATPPKPQQLDLDLPGAQQAV